MIGIVGKLFCCDRFAEVLLAGKIKPDKGFDKKTIVCVSISAVRTRIPPCPGCFRLVTPLFDLMQLYLQTFAFQVSCLNCGLLNLTYANTLQQKFQLLIISTLLFNSSCFLLQVAGKSAATGAQRHHLHR